MRRLGRLFVASAAAALLLASVPTAHGATTLVVDDDGMAVAGDCDAVTPASPTIQGAVTAAAPGDMIVVCPGAYLESVTVSTPNLRIRGAQAGVDGRKRRLVPLSEESQVNPPATLPGFSFEANGIVLNGFTVRDATDNAGIYTSPLSDGYRVQNNILTENTFGLYLHSAGDQNSVVRFNRFADNNEPGSASGNGIYSDQGAEQVVIDFNAFGDHTNSAILFAYSPPAKNSDVIIDYNKSTNDATFVNLLQGSHFMIGVNHTRDTVNADDGVQGPAIRVGGQSKRVFLNSNLLRNPASSGVAVRDDGLGTGLGKVFIANNTIARAEANGIDVTSTVPAVVKLRYNTLHNNEMAGISFGAGTSDNLIRRATSLRNGGFDCHDASTGTHTAGTANFWRRTVGRNNSPDGLCRPPGWDRH